MKNMQRIAVLCLTTLAVISGSPHSRGADVLTPGLLKFSIYTNIAGANVTDLTSNPNYPASPGEVRYLRSLNTRDAAPNDVLQSFGGRIEGFLTPLQSGDYHFFLRSDSGSQLLLSTDELEVNATVIAQELDRGDTFMEPGGDAATSTAITLTAGQRYFIMVLYKGNTGGGNSTDFAQVAWRKTDDVTPARSLRPIDGAFLSALTSDAAGPSITITQQPQNITVAENSRATFTVSADVTPTNYVAIVWQRNGTNIPGATGTNYTRFMDKADDGVAFRAVISVPGLTVTSAEAITSVPNDTTSPFLVGARGGPNRPEVKLAFSERLDQTTVGELSNYEIIDTNGVPLNVTGAVLTEDKTQVILTTAAQTIGMRYVITIFNIADLAIVPNFIATSNTATFYGLGPWLQGDDGFVVWEAEDYDRNPDGLWVLNTDRGVPSGGACMVNHNGAGGSEFGTHLEYDIYFTKTGTNIIWWRFSGNDGNDDSSWVHLNGVRLPGRESGNLSGISGTGSSLLGNWGWTANAAEGGGQLTFVIATPGVHTIGIGRREDGSYADKFVITTDPNFNPTAGFSTFGPAVTLRQGEPAPPGIADFEFVVQPVSTQALENTAITLTSLASIPPGVLFSYQWQRQQGADFADIIGATATNLIIDPLTLNWNGAVLRLRATVGSTVKYSSNATITVIAETNAPQIIKVTGSATRSQVVVVFSEPVTSVSAQEVSNYEIAAGAVAVTAATLLPNNRMVVLDTGPMSVGTKYTLTVFNVADTAATPNSIVNASANFYALGQRQPQGADGLLVFEAEDFDRNAGSLWIVDRTRGTPSAGASVVLPNGTAGQSENSKLEYDLTFTQTGTNIIWYRARGDSGSDDSGFLHLDGARPPERAAGNLAGLSGFDVGLRGDFVWRSEPFEGGGQMTFEIASPGVHVIGLARREDGSFFDKFVITTDPNFDPTDYGTFGPPETREGSPSLPTLAISSPVSNTQFTVGANIQIVPQVGATTRIITKVEFFNGATKIGQSTTSPYEFTWQGAPEGTNSLTVMLTDDTLETVRSKPVPVIVTQSPGGEITVSITRTLGDLTLNWAGGSPPYTIQKKTTLSDTNWIDLATNTTTSFSITATGASGFYRIRSP
jgi:hypothetical protein